MEIILDFSLDIKVCLREKPLDSQFGTAALINFYSWEKSLTETWECPGSCLASPLLSPNMKTTLQQNTTNMYLTVALALPSTASIPVPTM